MSDEEKQRLKEYQKKVSRGKNKVKENLEK